MVIAFLLLIAIISSNDPISYAESYRISSDNIWRDIDESYLVLSKGRLLFPNRYRTLFADFENLTFQLGNAPLEFSNGVEKNELILSLPLPEGRNERYRIYDSPVVEPTLADKYPFISTYTAIGVDDTQSQGRLDLTSAGFHAMLVTSQGTIFYLY